MRAPADRRMRRSEQLKVSHARLLEFVYAPVGAASKEAEIVCFRPSG